MHIAKVAAVIVAVALFLEVFVFNINFYKSLGYNSIDLSDAVTLQETTDEQYKITEVDNVIEFSNLNTEVHNVYLKFDWMQPAQNLTFKIQFTDDAHKTYFDSTEYTLGVPEVDMSTMVSESQYVNLQTTGYVDNLRIELVGNEKTSYPVRLTSLVLNAHRPFSFNFLRFFGVVGILSIMYLFRPGSSVYRVSITKRPKVSKAGVIGAVAVEVGVEVAEQLEKVARAHPVGKVHPVGQIADDGLRGGAGLHARDGDRAARRLQKAAQKLDERRLARAVRAEQADDAAAADVQLQVVQHNAGAVVFAQIRAGNQKFLHLRILLLLQ